MWFLFSNKPCPRTHIVNTYNHIINVQIFGGSAEAFSRTEESQNPVVPVTIHTNDISPQFRPMETSVDILQSLLGY